MQPFAITVEPGSFNEVLKKVDEIAIEKKTNRSAVLRQIWYDYFGIKVDDSKAFNCSRLIEKNRNV